MKTTIIALLLFLTTSVGVAAPVGWAVGGNGAILKTTNLGESWTATYPTTAVLSGVFFTDEQRGWVVGGTGTLMHTTNGGVTWSFASLATRDFHSLFFINQNLGWIVGAGGVIMKTTNAGATWRGMYPTSRTLRSVWFLSASVGVAVGDVGSILRTTNGGETWSYYSPTTQDFHSLHFVNSTTGWAVGSGGAMFKTTNAGVSWSGTYPSGAVLRSVRFVSSSVGVAVGNIGTVMVTTNGGASWSFRSLTTQNANSLYFINSSTGWAVGSGGLIMKTTDTGSTWHMNYTTGIPLRSVFFVNSASPGAPVITQNPSSITVRAGQTATFTVMASGTAPLTYRWQKNGVTISGAMGSSYTTPPVVLSNNGSTFRCIVTNAYGTATSNAATLTVTTVGVGPTITQQPLSVTVQPGQTATFRVTVSGTSPLSYQWQRNGVNLAGATTSSYTTPPASLSDNGTTFRCRVANSYGSATSASAVLAVRSTASSITVRNSSTPPEITVRINGQHTLIGPGHMVTIPLSAPSALYIWECLWVNNAWSCRWDGPYTVTPGGRYKVLDGFGGHWDLRLVNDALYTISCSSGPSNGGTATGGGAYSAGATATVRAFPTTGWQFVDWRESGMTVSTSATYSFVVSRARTLVATFRQTMPGSITVRNASTPPEITVRVNSQNHLLGPNQTATIPLVTSTTLYIWECLWNGTGWSCRWDPYPVVPGGRYKVIDGPGVHWDLRLATDASLSPVTEAGEQTVEVPTEFRLEQNYPNPFNPTTAIVFELPEQASVTLKVFDMLGREVATLEEGVKPAGSHQVQFDAANLASGMYFYRFTAGHFTAMKRMMLVR